MLASAPVAGHVGRAWRRSDPGRPVAPAPASWPRGARPASRSSTCSGRGRSATWSWWSTRGSSSRGPRPSRWSRSPWPSSAGRGATGPGGRGASTSGPVRGRSPCPWPSRPAGVHAGLRGLWPPTSTPAPWRWPAANLAAWAADPSGGGRAGAPVARATGSARSRRAAGPGRPGGLEPALRRPRPSGAASTPVSATSPRALVAAVGPDGRPVWPPSRRSSPGRPPWLARPGRWSSSWRPDQADRRPVALARDAGFAMSEVTRRPGRARPGPGGPVVSPSAVAGHWAGRRPAELRRGGGADAPARWWPSRPTPSTAWPPSRPSRGHRRLFALKGRRPTWPCRCWSAADRPGPRRSPRDLASRTPSMLARASGPARSPWSCPARRPSGHAGRRRRRATVGLRLPDHRLVRACAAGLGPLAVTSANRHGEPPCHRRGDGRQLAAAVSAGDQPAAPSSRPPWCSTAGRCDGAPSTVADCTVSPPGLPPRGRGALGLGGGGAALSGPCRARPGVSRGPRTPVGPDGCRCGRSPRRRPGPPARRGRSRSPRLRRPVGVRQATMPRSGRPSRSWPTV